MPLPPLTDTHAHLCAEEFDGDRAQVVERARAAGVASVVAVGESLADAERNLRLAEEFPGFLRLAMGLFPTRLDLQEADAIEALIRRTHREEPGLLAAVGEVGLDRWVVKEEEDRELQRRIFARFIRLAGELDLPLNVHSRSAGHYAIDVLLEHGAKKVQLHAFDGKPGKTDPAREAGYFFSVPPSVVRSKQKQKLVRYLPLSCLLLETDSPVLGPDRESRNEPANLRISLQAVADLKELPVEEVAEAVAENTRRLYG